MRLGFTRFYWVWLGLTGFRQVLMGFTGFRFDFTGFYMIKSGFTGFCLGFTGFYWVLLGFTVFHWFLLGFIGFYWVLSGFFWFLLGFAGFYWVSLVFTGFHWFWLGFIGFYWVLTGFYRVLLGFTGFDWVLLDFTGFYWVLLGFIGFYWALMDIGEIVWNGNERSLPPLRSRSLSHVKKNGLSVRGGPVMNGCDSEKGTTKQNEEERWVGEEMVENDEMKWTTNKETNETKSKRELERAVIDDPKYRCTIVTNRSLFSGAQLHRLFAVALYLVSSSKRSRSESKKKGDNEWKKGGRKNADNGSEWELGGYTRSGRQKRWMRRRCSAGHEKHIWNDRNASINTQ